MFDFDKDYTLESDAVLLRPMTSDDFQYLLPFAINEPDIWKYTLSSAAGEESLRAYMAKALQARADLAQYPFIVWDKRQQRYAGCTRFYNIDFVNNSLSVGYTWYSKASQGTGLNKHCKYLLFDFAFNQMNIDRIELRADARNERSRAAIRSVGCTEECILYQSDILPDGTYRDSVLHRLLRTEWDAWARKSLLEKINTKSL